MPLNSINFDLRHIHFEHSYANLGNIRDEYTEVKEEIDEDIKPETYIMDNSEIKEEIDEDELTSEICGEDEIKSEICIVENSLGKIEDQDIDDHSQLLESCMEYEDELDGSVSSQRCHKKPVEEWKEMKLTKTTNKHCAFPHNTDCENTIHDLKIRLDFARSENRLLKSLLREWKRLKKSEELTAVRDQVRAGESERKCAFLADQLRKVKGKLDVKSIELKKTKFDMNILSRQSYNNERLRLKLRGVMKECDEAKIRNRNAQQLQTKLTDKNHKLKEAEEVVAELKQSLIEARNTLEVKEKEAGEVMAELKQSLIEARSALELKEKECESLKEEVARLDRIMSDLQVKKEAGE